MSAPGSLVHIRADRFRTLCGKTVGPRISIRTGVAPTCKRCKALARRLAADAANLGSDHNREEG